MLKYLGLGLVSAFLFCGAPAFAQQSFGAPVTQPGFQPGSGSSQPFIYSPGPTFGGQSSSSNGSSFGSVQGPVTGFGRGGLAPIPGSPPNQSRMGELISGGAYRGALTVSLYRKLTPSSWKRA
jgi:hypothetical protein